MTIARLRTYVLDRLGIRSPSLTAQGVRPSLRWVLGGAPDPLPVEGRPLTEEQVARLLAHGRRMFDL